MTFVNGVCPISRPNTAKKTSCEISGLSAWNLENKTSFTMYSNALADSFAFIRTQLTTHLWSTTGSLKTLALRQSYTLQGYMLLKLSFAWKPGYSCWCKQLFILRWFCHDVCFFCSLRKSWVGSKTNMSHGVPRNSIPFADTIYCLQTWVNLWHFIILILMSTNSK